MFVRAACCRHRRPGVRHPWRLGLLLTAAGLSHAGCSRSDHAARTDPRIDLTWTLRPSTPTVGPATLSLSLRTPAGDPIKGATVRIEGHMTHAGMTPLTAEAVERAPGVYEAGFGFTMQGDWALLVSVEFPGGARVERRIDVANVRPSG